MVLRSAAPVLSNDEVKYATDILVEDGNVWSETRLNKRAHMTRTRVATFSGASRRARRTRDVCDVTVLFRRTRWTRTVIGRNERKYIGC